MSRFIKVSTFVLAIGALVYGSIILLGSLYLKHVIEKYDKAYTGREVELKWLYLNPITGYLTIQGLMVYEAQSDSVFISTKNIELRFSPLTLISGSIDLGPVLIDAAILNIKQTKQFFNFSDLRVLLRQQVRFEKHINLLSLKLSHAGINYNDPLLPIKYSIHELSIETAAKKWYETDLSAAFNFSAPNDTGSVKGMIQLKLNTSYYRLALKVSDYPVDPIEPYLNAMSNYCEFKARLDAHLFSQGNLKHRDDYTNTGTLQLSNLHLGKNSENDYFSFSNLNIGMRKISPQNYSYHYDSITIYDPYFKYERYVNSDNIRAMFGKEASLISAVKRDSNQFNLVIELGRYLKTMSRNLLKSNYTIKHLAMYGGQLKFNDFSTTEKFTGDLEAVAISADSLDARRNHLVVQVKSQIKQGGSIALSFSLDPKNPINMDVFYLVKEIPLVFFNPYVISNATFGFTRGDLDIDGFWKIRTGMITSSNQLVIRNAEIKKRPRHDGIQYLPAHLILAILKNRKQEMKFLIPIEGQIDHPQVKIKLAFFDALQRRNSKPIIVLSQDKLTRF